MQQFTAEDVQERLKGHAAVWSSDSDLAEHIGISRSHMSRLLDGKANPGTKVLDYLDMKSVVIYVDKPFSK